MLRGTPLVAGSASGPARIAAPPGVRRVTEREFQGELARFTAALSSSRRGLDALASRAPAGALAEALVDHALGLRDPVFEADVEHLILGENLALESALAKVVFDFEETFGPAGLHLLRRLENGAGAPHVRVTRAPILADMVCPGVCGIVAEEAELRAPLEELARVLDLPLVVGVEGLLEHVRAGDVLALDGETVSVGTA